MTTNEDIKAIVDIESEGLEPTADLDPCGLLPRYFPTDSFDLIEHATSGDTVAITTKGLYDTTYERYNYSNSTNIEDMWLDVTDVRFSIWMKLRSSVSPYKQWGVLRKNLQAGDYFIHINLKYLTSFFNGGKNIIVTSNTGMYTTHNSFIVFMFLIVGLTSAIMTTVYLFTWLKSRKERVVHD